MAASSATMPARSWRCVVSWHGMPRAELLILAHDGGHLDCPEGLRLAERVLNIPSLHDPLRQEANPEPTERGAASRALASRGRTLAGAPATAGVDGVSGGFATAAAARAPGRTRAPLVAGFACGAPGGVCLPRSAAPW